MKTNIIYCGDCKDVLRDLPEKSVDLIYVDPPFFTSKNYEIAFVDGYEIRSFQDAHWYNKKGKRRNDIYVYLDWLKEKVVECHRILEDTGSFYLHCDWHANAYIRVYILDEVFGNNNFKNEIIWCYRGATSPRQRVWARKHDVIFLYTKDKKRWTFNVDDVRLPYSKTSIEREGYTKTGFTTDGICKLNPKGRFPEDWWEIPFIRPNSKERLGFPTQKPEALLERIIKASSDPTDIVLDPMCGCGTTLVAAHRLGRRWIGIDISPTGCKLMRDRLRKNFDELNANPPEIKGLPMSIEDLKKIGWADFQNWICERIGGKSAEKKVRDKGIDGFTFPERIPIQVKQSESVGRPEVDKFEVAVGRYYGPTRKEKKGVMIAFSFSSEAYNEASRSKIENGIDMQLKTVAEILGEE